ncbi:uncharacterized protein LOC114469305 [Gouania willdenowi]|uniref:uncharacterized protein LOC114458968 n=1 Tax=Gouania willdenowi TaxID=441366 RepID=UPI0010565D9B|nr:uncharacterized protein LOC114458968 [Gouania willdenowi]XP_028312477.1 uncharacterized protein LOC114469305 [Gouania willdenowi]
MLDFTFSSTVVMNESDKSTTSHSLRACARVTAHTGNRDGTEGSAGAAMDETGIGSSATTGEGNTFPPAKSFPRINETPLTGNRGHTATLTGPDTNGDCRCTMCSGTLITVIPMPHINTSASHEVSSDRVTETKPCVTKGSKRESTSNIAAFGGAENNSGLGGDPLQSCLSENQRPICDLHQGLHWHPAAPMRLSEVLRPHSHPL